ncbi:Platinum sensitivity protein, partial [Spiromyces aspiralis]
ITPIESAAVEAKINQTSHLIFLRDIVLTNILDDELQGMLGSLIFLRHIEIIKHFQQDQHYMKRLFRILGLESADSVEQKRDVVTFMHQFCSIVKMIPPTYCSGVYRSLSQYGLFNLFRFALQDDDKRIKQAGVEILGSVLAQDRALVRSFALDQVKHQQSQHGEGSIGNQTLLGLLVDSIRKAGGMNDGEEEGGIHSQCGDIIRVLLDTTVSAGAGDSNSNNYGGNGSDEFEGSQKNGENKDKSPQAKKGMDVETAEFLECFYSKYMAEMMRPLFVIDEATIPKIDASRLRAWVVQFLCEILTLSVTHHSCRSRYFVFSSDVVDHIVKLFSCKRKELKLAALR